MPAIYPDDAVPMTPVDKVREYIAVAREVAGRRCEFMVPRLMRMLAMRRAAHIGAVDYAYFGLAELTAAQGATFLTKGQLDARLREYNPPEHRDAVQDKAQFAVRCAQVGLPAVETLALVAPAPRWSQFTEVSDEVQRIGDRQAFEVFVERCRSEGVPVLFKPFDGTYGLGTQTLRFEGAILFSSAGVSTTREALWSALTHNLEVMYLVQPWLAVHEDLRGVMPGEALGTVRIVTLVSGEDVQVQYAFAKIPVLGQVIDNFAGGANGNLLAAVDVETGQLGNAWMRAPEHRYTLSEAVSHPDTGQRFDEVHIPLWSEVLEMTRRAALAFDEMTCLGWDVAVTTAGVRLLEANISHDPDGPQITRRVSVDRFVPRRQ